MPCTQSPLKRLKSRLFTTFLTALLASLTIPAALAGSWQQNMSLGGFNSVHLYTPDSASAIGEGQALLVVLHGCTQPIGAFLTANLEAAAEENGMVVAVPDAMNKAGFSCWSYWQGTISRSAGDYKNLIGLANALTSDPDRNIDPNQVYITGLSSGAAFAAQAGCLAPDIFAGVAPSAGPTIGTSSSGAISTCETVSSSQFKSRCEGYAGSNANHFESQVAVIAHGDADTTVNSCYNQQNANGFANVYGVSQLAGSNTVTEGAGNAADEHLWQENRVAMLWLNGLDHSWSGGAGASGSYVSSTSINFASYLGKHFAENNKRVDRNKGPVVEDLNAVAVNNTFDISGTAVDMEGSVTTVTIEISNIDSGTAQPVETLDTGVDTADQFSSTTTSLDDGLYKISALGTDDEGKHGDSMSVTARLGPEPPSQAPVISDLAVALSGQCATITGTAVDANQDLAAISVTFTNETVSATLDGNTTSADFSAQACGLPGGSNTATATASDTAGNSNQAAISFEVDAGVAGNYNLHINQGHISWGDGYSACYLEFGDNVFTMREFSASGGQCEWIADGAPACNGPLQACSSTDNGDGDGGGNDVDGDGIDDSLDNCPTVANGNQADNDGDGIGNACDSTPDGAEPCEQFTSYNYYHKSAGRAYSSGYYWSPAYYATGSDAAMSGSTWASTTLHSTNGSIWQMGACP